MTDFDINELIDNYGKKVYNLAFRITGSRQDAEGIIDNKGPLYIDVIIKKLDSQKGSFSVYHNGYRLEA